MLPKKSNTNSDAATVINAQNYGAETPMPMGEPEGIVYRRTDRNGKIKPYIGQAKSEERFLQRQKKHTRANPNADFEFEIIDRATPGKALDAAEQKHIDASGGPTNKNNPNGGLSNKKNNPNGGLSNKKNVKKKK